MAWIVAPGLTMHRQTQAYSRLGHQLYVYENLDGSGFSAELAVDEGGIVLRHDKVAEGVIADKAEPPAAMPEPAGAIAKLDLAPALCVGRHHSAKLPSACATLDYARHGLYGRPPGLRPHRCRGPAGGR
jgi:hypothetical protein